MRQALSLPSFVQLRYLLLCMAVLGSGAREAAAQFRESFESTLPSWRLREADCGVRQLAQQRTFQQSRSGNGSEYLRLTVLNQGTFIRVAHPIGRAAVIAELAPSVWVKSDKPNVQMMLRAVFPKTIDDATGEPLADFILGDSYTDVGRWQELKVTDVPGKLDKALWARRRQLAAEKKKVDESGAYVDMVVLNAYSSPGNIDLWLDDLEIQGYVSLDDAAGNRATATAQRPGNETSDPRGGAALQGSLLMVGGRPMMPRVIEHNGEPLEWLHSLGFNTVRLRAEPTPKELKEARRLGLWLVAPPPVVSEETPIGAAYDRVLAWSLGTNLAARELPATQELAAEIRRHDSRRDRPLVCQPATDLFDYSRISNLLILDQPTLATSFELSAYRPWLLGRPKLARPGTPLWSTIPTHLPEGLREQLLLMTEGQPLRETLPWQQLRLTAYSALASGSRGLVFHSSVPLSTDSLAGSQRVDALKLLNFELLLLEPWAAAGTLVEDIPAPDAHTQVSMLQTERSKLLVVTRHVPAQQYVAAPADTRPISLVIPGVPISDRAYQVTLAGPRLLHTSHGSGGIRIQLDEPGLASAIVITQDPLVLHHLDRVLGEGKLEIGRLRYEVAAREMTQAADVDRELSAAGHPLAAAPAWLREAQTHLDQARRGLETMDQRTLHAAANLCEQTLAKVRRGHWEQTAAAFPSPAASPCVAQFGLLPLHWEFAKRLRRNAWGPNSLAAGEMESLNQLLNSGWKQHRGMSESLQGDVSLALQSPHGGRSALRLSAWAVNPKEVPVALERPPLWITSAPIPVRQGQLARIHGWAHVPKRLGASQDGLLLFDNFAGPRLGERIQISQGWREFTLYRAIPKNGELTLTISLTGLGEASLDDLSISLINPDPIREVARPRQEK
jgi:hypothetical protein